MSKPFLILQLRPEDAASDNEFEAFLKYGGPALRDAQRVRMEQDGIPAVDLKDYSGVIVGGGPFNISDVEEKKSKAQKKMEADLGALLDRVVAEDFPYLGECYGIGVLAKHKGAVVSKEKYAEDVGGVTITLTEEGVRDSLLQGLPKEFRAFAGHKEACQVVPAGAVLLASSQTCPVQMVRVGRNVYGTQFHTALDYEGLLVRIEAYRHAGYFPPEEAEKLAAALKNEIVRVPMTILERFVERYRRE